MLRAATGEVTLLTGHNEFAVARLSEFHLAVEARPDTIALKVMATQLRVRALARGYSLFFGLPCLIWRSM
jgi:hypothetical protein